MPRLAITLLFGLVFAFIAACGDSYGNGSPSPSASPAFTAGQPLLRTIEVQLDDGEAFTVEVADDPAERTQGLSGREGLDDGAGMLFVWEAEDTHTLWMKDMLFALDFVWLDADRTVVSINHQVQPQPAAPDSELVRYTPASPAKYAIELDAGEAEALGIEVGDVLQFDERSD